MRPSHRSIFKLTDINLIYDYQESHLKSSKRHTSRSELNAHNDEEGKFLTLKKNLELEKLE